MVHTQTITREILEGFVRPTFAAGAVLWRKSDSGYEIAVAHRPFYDDWSLPKGKLDPGESLPVTAAREILEETSYTAQLGALLGHISYPVKDRTKVVFYWTAEVLEGTFTPNEEVDELRWVSADDAKDLLTYDIDQEVVAQAAERIAAEITRESTARILYVRHAHAHSAATWSGAPGADDTRPLDKKGRRQAEALAPMLSAYHPNKVYSALPDRCRSTAQPLADALGVTVQVNPLLGDAAWVDSPRTAREALMELLKPGETVVVVAQGTIIPGMLASLAGAEDAEHDAASFPSKKASTWVLSFSKSELISADYLESPLPVK